MIELSVRFERKVTMKAVPWRVVAGVLLVLVGLLLLLQTFNVLTFLWTAVWAVLFCAGGAYFWAMFLGHRSQWWAAIPGAALLGIGALIGLSLLGLGNVFGGALFLAALSVGFWLVYLRTRENWWAVIPGGVLLTLAAVAGLEGVAPRLDTGGIFFLGLALTFALVYLLPMPGGRMRWALIPAGVLFVVGLVVTMATTSAMGIVWAVALIAGGAYLVYRTVRS
jgi:hypothetical protein